MLLAHKKTIFSFMRKKDGEITFQEIERQKTTNPPALNLTGI